MFNIGPSMGMLMGRGFWNPQAPKLDPSTGQYTTPNTGGPVFQKLPQPGMGNRPSMPTPDMPQRGGGGIFTNPGQRIGSIRPQVEPRRAMLGNIGNSMQGGIFKAYGSGPNAEARPPRNNLRMLF